LYFSPIDLVIKPFSYKNTVNLTFYWLKAGQKTPKMPFQDQKCVICHSFSGKKQCFG